MTLTGTKTGKQTQAGAPVVERKLPGWPYSAPDEIEAAVRVLESGKINYWTGDEGRRFEAEFAAFVGCKYAVALANGTVALELALFAADLRRGPQIRQNRGQEQDQEHPQPRAAVPHEDG